MKLNSKQKITKLEIEENTQIKKNIICKIHSKSNKSVYLLLYFV